MEKVKFMLIAIAVFTGVGGALAFKAKKVMHLKYVIIQIHFSGQVCATLAVNSTVLNPTGGFYSAVLDTFTDNVSCQTVTCPNFGIPNWNNITSVAV